MSSRTQLLTAELVVDFRRPPAAVDLDEAWNNGAESQRSASSAFESGNRARPAPTRPAYLYQAEEITCDSDGGSSSPLIQAQQAKFFKHKHKKALYKSIAR